MAILSMDIGSVEDVISERNGFKSLIFDDTLF